MTKKLENFIRANISLIDDYNYMELYKKCNPYDRKDLTEFLLSCDIRPDDYMQSIPPLYLQTSKITDYNISPSITGIGDSAFHRCSKLSQIHLPQGVFYIGPNSFNSCSNLRKVTLPEGLLEIDMGAFESCWELTSIKFPGTLRMISDEAFAHCHSLQNISFNGTTKEWIDKVSLGVWVFDRVPAVTVRCLDGEVSIED